MGQPRSMISQQRRRVELRPHCSSTRLQRPAVRDEGGPTPPPPVGNSHHYSTHTNPNYIWAALPLFFPKIDTSDFLWLACKEELNSIGCLFSNFSATLSRKPRSLQRTRWRTARSEQNGGRAGSRTSGGARRHVTGSERPHMTGRGGAARHVTGELLAT